MFRVGKRVSFPMYGFYDFKQHFQSNHGQNEHKMRFLKKGKLNLSK